MYCYNKLQSIFCFLALQCTLTGVEGIAVGRSGDNYASFLLKNNVGGRDAVDMGVHSIVKLNTTCDKLK